MSYKPFVSGVPEITSITLDGSEDFLVLGCDGLWDSVKEVDVAATVYEQLHNEPGKLYFVTIFFFCENWVLVQRARRV